MTHMIATCWGFGEIAPEEAIPRLADIGIEAIELWPGDLRRIGPKRWHAALQKSGLKCVQLCPYFNFMHGPVSVEMGRSVLIEFLAAAEIMECKRLRAFTGPPWGEWQVGAKKATDEQWNAAIDGLREYCTAAGKQGVELCLECHANSLIEDVPTVTRLITSVGVNNLTVNLQLPLLNTRWEDAVDGLAKWTTHMHIHNWDQDFDKGNLTFIGEGVIDYVPILKRLKALGKTPVLSLEHIDHSKRHDPWEVMRRDVPFLRALRAKI